MHLGNHVLIDEVKFGKCSLLEMVKAPGTNETSVTTLSK